MKRLLFLFALLLVAAPSEAQAPDATAPAAAESAVETARRERVYARIGDRTIRVGDIEDALAAQTPFQQARYRDDPAKLRELADRLVQLEVLAVEARRLDLQDSPRVRELVDGNLVQLLMRHAIDERITPQSITDAEVAAYFAAHQDEYARPALARASHVLVATEAEARALLDQCRTVDVAAFRQLARDRSLDTETNQTGGDLRYFTADGRPQGNAGRPIEAGIATAAFAIPEVGGCAAAPVPVGDRFSVVKLTGRREAEASPLAIAQEGIRRKLWRERRDHEVEVLVDEIRTRVRVSQRNELLRLVEVAPPNPAELAHRHGDEPEPTAEERRMQANPLQRPRTPSMR